MRNFLRLIFGYLIQSFWNNFTILLKWADELKSPSTAQPIPTDKAVTAPTEHSRQTNHHSGHTAPTTHWTHNATELTGQSSHETGNANRPFGQSQRAGHDSESILHSEASHPKMLPSEAKSIGKPSDLTMQLSPEDLTVLLDECKRFHLTIRKHCKTTMEATEETYQNPCRAYFQVRPCDFCSKSSI